MHFIMLWSTCLLSSDAEPSICCKPGWHWGHWTLLWLLFLGTKYPGVFPQVVGSSLQSFVKAAVLQDKLSPWIPSNLQPVWFPLGRGSQMGLEEHHRPCHLPPWIPAWCWIKWQTCMQEAEPKLQLLLWQSIAACLQSWTWALHLQSSAPFQSKMGEVWGPKDPYFGLCSISLCLILAGVPWVSAQAACWEQSWWSQPCASTGAWQEGCPALETWLKADAGGERSYCSLLQVVRGNVQCITFWDTFPENVSLS